MWKEIQTSFLKALKQQRVDKWLIEEKKHNGDAVVKYRSFSSIQDWLEYLEIKVAEEESASSGLSNSPFIAMGTDY